MRNVRRFVTARSRDASRAGHERPRPIHARFDWRPAWEVLDRISRGGHILVLSAPLLSELADVLQRPRFQAAIGLNGEQAIRFTIGLEKAAEIVDLSGTPAVEIPHDPKDVDVVLTAIAGRAEVICTLDRHLRDPQVLAVCQATGIRVLSDVELLNELRAADSGEPTT